MNSSARVPTDVAVGGKTEPAYGCRLADGSRKVVND
jgi:hypothetical protein